MKKFFGLMVLSMILSMGLSSNAFAGLPDLAVTADLTADGKVSITIHNVGDGLPASVPVGISVQRIQDDKGAGGWKTVNSMPALSTPNSKVTFVPYQVPLTGTFTVQIDVDPDRNIPEANENNNRCLRTFTYNPSGNKVNFQTVNKEGLKTTFDGGKIKMMKRF